MFNRQSIMANETVEETAPPKKEQVHFQEPAIQNNPDGWGPFELPDQFKDIPYQPFSKGDRLGKVSVSHMPRSRLSRLFDRKNCLVFDRLTVPTDFRLDRSGVPGQKVHQ